MVLIVEKEPKILIDWIEQNMSSIFFKKHLKFITYVQLLLKFLFAQYAKQNNLLGYVLTFKGKLNKLGNVRKRKLIYSNDLITLSNVYQKTDVYSKPIVTITGVINCKIIINYY